MADPHPTLVLCRKLAFSGRLALPNKVFQWICVMVAFSVWAGAPSVVSAQEVDFAREVLPILSNKCFVCHGPDAKEDVTLRMDSFEAATHDLGGYQAINPAAPKESEVLARIFSDDDPMPPRDAEKQLTSVERDLIERWVLQGGSYAKHWAFVVPVKRAFNKSVPVSDAIDTFVHDRLNQRGLQPASRADKTALARRAALVLTGLPPEPQLREAFLADQREGAYGRFVDELLNSSRYGEHQARYWLDAVRYGDTHGLHLDNRRGIYPYRDWVIHALNQNLPLDHFITWQLAGDLLPHATLAQRVATGFVRLNPSTSEGGALPEEFQCKNNFDRTETLGTVLLGMSLTCARCHTHKYDPIPQTEYYRLLAFFNSTAERPMDGNAYVYGPHVKAPANLLAWSAWEELENERRSLFETVHAELQGERWTQTVSHAKRSLAWTSQNWKTAGPLAGDVAGPEDAGWKPIEGLPGTLQQKLPKAGQAVWISVDLVIPQSQVLWLTFRSESGAAVSVDGEPVEATTTEVRDGDRVMIPLVLSQGEHQVRLKLLGKDSEPLLEVRLENAWQQLGNGTPWAECDPLRKVRMLRETQGPFAGLNLQGRAGALEQEMSAAEQGFTTTLVARDLPEPRVTKVLRRGEYNLPTGEPLEPGILSVMGQFPAAAPRNRLGLAQWLTSPDHPLVSRVLINRIWQRVFGYGLVRTPEDFGLQGEQPTHRELLDWLAVELQDSGWDLKHMLRLMVTSDTFQQSSAWRDDVEDPENRLLARGPRHRLDAEVLRDIGLWASGLLDPHMGGEGVKPYQPSGMWKAMAHPGSNTKQYVRDKGELLYRRSLYVYWKRTSPHPMMTLFDAPDRESSCVRRSRTNTALQSLGLLNETQRIEMARALAERLLRECDGDADRMDLLFSLIACRVPTDSERAACDRLLGQMRDRYGNSHDDAIALLSIGDAARDRSMDAVQHAAWTQVVVTVLASDLAILLY